MRSPPHTARLRTSASVRRSSTTLIPFMGNALRTVPFHVHRGFDRQEKATSSFPRNAATRTRRFSPTFWTWYPKRDATHNAFESFARPESKAFQYFDLDHCSVDSGRRLDRKRAVSMPPSLIHVMLPGVFDVPRCRLVHRADDLSRQADDQRAGRD